VGLHVLDEDAAVVLVDDLLHDREAEARALRLRGDVGLEDLPMTASAMPVPLSRTVSRDPARAKARRNEDARASMPERASSAFWKRLCSTWRSMLGSAWIGGRLSQVAARC
jgi:hypothetical protein